MEKVVPVILLFFLIACSSQKFEQLPKGIKNLKNLTIYSSNTKADTVQLTREQSFGNNGTILIGRISGMAVDKKGRVFIVAAKKQTIDILQPDGTYLTHIGGKGKGPGEFMTIDNIKIAHSRLYVYDGLNLGKISVFSLSSLKLVKELGVSPLSGMKNGHPFYIFNDSSLLISLIDASPPNKPRKIHFYTFDRGKYNKSDEIFKKRYKIIYGVTSGHHAYYGIKPGGRTTLVVKNNHSLYTAWTGHFLIKIYNFKGKYIRSFYYPYKKVPLDKRKLFKEFPEEGRQVLLNKLTLSKTWPALHSMKSDSQNRLWISTIVKNHKVYQWWVLNKKGKLLAKFNWPRDKPIKVIKNGKVYTKEASEKGVQRIVKYKIQMREK